MALDEEPEPGGPHGSLAVLREVVPFEAAVDSDRLAWVGLEAARYHAAPASELNPPTLSRHWLVLVTRPPDELDLVYDGVKRHVPPPAGSIFLLPAGSQSRWRWSGRKDSLHVHLEPALVEQVGAEAFGLDPARVSIPPLDGLDLPQFRAAMCAVDAELTSGGAGGPLAAESLANVLAVDLIRHVLAPREHARRRDGVLPQSKVRAVSEYVEGRLDTGPSLNEMAATAQLSVYHFARQFKAATGLPPHQYVTARRIERAKQLLQTRPDLSLAEIAALAGFSDQSVFSRHFKRLVGVTPGQFRTPARKF